MQIDTLGTIDSWVI